jgi:hypothetical protein
VYKKSNKNCAPAHKAHNPAAEYRRNCEAIEKIIVTIDNKRSAGAPA